MAYLSISGAARATGKDRGTIKRYLVDGRLSASKDATGKPQIDTSELMRVFGTLKTDGAPDAAPEKPQDTPGNTTMLQVVIEALNGQLHAAQEREEWLKAQLEVEQQRSRELELRLLPPGAREAPQGEGPASVAAARQGQGWADSFLAATFWLVVGLVGCVAVYMIFKKVVN